MTILNDILPWNKGSNYIEGVLHITLTLILEPHHHMHFIFRPKTLVECLTICRDLVVVQRPQLTQ